MTTRINKQNKPKGGKAMTHEKDILDKGIKCLFMAVAVMMYFFITEEIKIGVYVTFRHAFALMLFAIAFLYFLIRPNAARGAVAFKDALLYSVPLLVTVSFSLFVWFVGTVDTSVISRGLSSTFIYTNMLSFALAAGSFLYMFGEKGIWYNLVAILISNIFMILKIMATYGVGNYLSELIRLVVSFAGDTGDIIVQAEVHELAFCLGAYLIYMALKPRKNTVFFVLLALTLFCFVSAFKRIGILAITAALFFGLAIKFIAKFRESTAKGLVYFLTVCIILLLIGYIAVIKLGAFEYLEKQGVDTTGRAQIYKAVGRFYEFSPDFLGNGIGFTTYMLNLGLGVGVAAVHNDFLQYFIDLGFWGFITWLTSITLLRVVYFGKKNTESGVITFTLIMYLVIVSSTDNTMSYPLLTAVLAILMSGNDFDKRVRRFEKKKFGCVSDENKKKAGGKML